MTRLACRFLSLANLFVTATLALPQWKRTGGIRARLINRTVRRNYLTATTRAEAPTRRAFFYIDSKWVIVSHLRGDASAR